MFFTLKVVSRRLILLWALVPFMLMAQPAALVEGQDYELINAPGLFAAADGKIEVVEVFGYTCIHCANFEPLLAHWEQTLAEDVRFIRLPAAFGGVKDAWARAYYAAEQLGVLERSHMATFEALHQHRSLPMQGVSTTQLAEFHAHFGVDPEKYIEALLGSEVDGKVKAAHAFSQRTRVPGTPALIVNGKYLVRGNSFEDFLRITDALIVQERQAASSDTK